jgi:hypothetical protein
MCIHSCMGLEINLYLQGPPGSSPAKRRPGFVLATASGRPGDRSSARAIGGVSLPTVS